MNKKSLAIALRKNLLRRKNKKISKIFLNTMICFYIFYGACSLNAKGNINYNFKKIPFLSSSIVENRCIHLPSISKLNYSIVLFFSNKSVLKKAKIIVSKEIVDNLYNSNVKFSSRKIPILDLLMRIFCLLKF